MKYRGGLGFPTKFRLVNRPRPPKQVHQNPFTGAKPCIVICGDDDEGKRKIMTNILGKSLRIYLADGTPSGIKNAELVNWTGQALVCPRSRLRELAQWSEAPRPGVYFLFGEGADVGRAAAYIGEAEQVAARLKDHVRGKDFWQTCVLFTSKDDNLTKSHVKYLESRLITLAKEADRMLLENSTQPEIPALPRADRDAMEEFLGPLQILLGALGFRLLEPPARRANVDGTRVDTSDLFSMAVSKHGVQARGLRTDEGFVVLASSIGAVDASSNAKRRGRFEAMRQPYFEDGTFVPEGPNFRVTRDFVMSSSSYAAAIMVGYEMNGRTTWKNADGRTLREVEEAELATADGE